MTSRDEFETSPGRNPMLILGGAVLIGLALAVVLFGGNLFASNTQAPVSDLPQVPGSSAGNNEAAQPGGFSGNLLQVGDKPHDFALNDLDGNSVRLSDFEGRPVIINFWATWCAPCRIEMPDLQAAFMNHQDEGLVILAVDNQESARAVDLFFNELGLTFTPLLDTEGDVASLYNVVNYPTTYFVNAAGEITVIHRGLMVTEQIDTYLAQTIPGLG